ncbi:MAG: tRNA threonylcarbamoyladenosine dehydratase [Solobacterium sp.]|nr:tRNA threonylcarbamoyladenosine dehydratase [Solobacterium sp.]
MEAQYNRTRQVYGDRAMEIIRHARVAVFGLGGVGGYVVETLARAGIGTLDIIDHDTVDPSNLNRQIIALQDNIGRRKADVCEERIHAINPDIAVHKHVMFYLPETKDQLDLTQYDYIVDAIDTVTAKLDLAEEAEKLGIPLISSMGTGNRTDPFRLVCTDIYQTKGDPLAKIMRTELRKRGVKRLKVVYSEEPPVRPIKGPEDDPRTPASTPFVPAAAGIMIGSVVIRDLTGFDPDNR